MVHGIVTAGGAAPNIVPARTAAVYNLRAVEARSPQRLENRIRDCFEGSATATGCSQEVVRLSPVQAELGPDAGLSEEYRRAITTLGREPLDRGDEDRVIGSTDMGNVTRALPAIHPMIAVDCDDAVNHQAAFAAACATPDADRSALAGGARDDRAAVSAALDERSACWQACAAVVVSNFTSPASRRPRPARRRAAHNAGGVA